jgi:hypothetical protein
MTPKIPIFRHGFPIAHANDNSTRLYFRRYQRERPEPPLHHRATMDEPSFLQHRARPSRRVSSLRENGRYTGFEANPFDELTSEFAVLKIRNGAVTWAGGAWHSGRIWKAALIWPGAVLVDNILSSTSFLSLPSRRWQKERRPTMILLGTLTLSAPGVSPPTTSNRFSDSLFSAAVPVMARRVGVQRRRGPAGNSAEADRGFTASRCSRERWPMAVWLKIVKLETRYHWHGFGIGRYRCTASLSLRQSPLPQLVPRTR